MSIVVDPDTSETRYQMQRPARHQAITKLYADILMDMQVCEIEGWDKMEYIAMLQNLLNSIGEEQMKPEETKSAEVPRKTITDILDQMAADFCDNYCKWPEKYTEGGVEHSGRLYEERCGECPLNWIG